MYFCHSAKVWNDYPQLVPGLLLLDQISPDVELADRLAPFYEQARQRLAHRRESQMPEISAWRQAYAQMGLKPTKYRSAAEALLRRFKREDDVPRLHPLVDLCNAVSLAFALPVAVFDLAQVDGFLEVRYATGQETYLAFSGAVENPAPDEIIFVDAAQQVHARRWTFRQSRRSIITPQTSQALVVSEGLHDTAAQDIPALVDTLAQHITAIWQPPRRQSILSAAQPRLEFSL